MRCDLWNSSNTTKLSFAYPYGISDVGVMTLGVGVIGIFMALVIIFIISSVTRSLSVYDFFIYAISCLMFLFGIKQFHTGVKFKKHKYSDTFKLWENGYKCSRCGNIF